MPDLPDLFPGFDSRQIEGDGATLHLRIGGDGPPLVLLHGYPQSGVMWHKLAPALADSFTLVIPDLRGYGQSSVPASDTPATYSKRAMGNDIVAVMRQLGHDRFALAGHDRGGRVAYRMAFDHADRLSRVAVLDILPTYDYWLNMDWRAGLKIYHWLFLAQPQPLPETLLSAAPEAYLRHTLASWTACRDLSSFDPGALQHYLEFFRQPERIHATCEDYRAGASVDMDLDSSDRDAARTIELPLLALWGSAGIAAGTADPLETWRLWAPGAQGQAVDGGHFIAEENPDDTADALRAFFAVA